MTIENCVPHAHRQFQIGRMVTIGVPPRKCLGSVN
jgi:hypothetical protein